MLLAALVLAAAPLEARYVLLVSDVPVAALRIWSDGARYRYESTHFLEEGPAERTLELPLAPGTPVPEVLALSRRPAPGCRDVLEERGRRVERLCVDPGAGASVRGTLDGQRFVARYDAARRLEEITVGAARWQATQGPLAPPAESPFVKGVPVPAGPHLVLRPPVEGAAWLGRTPKATGTEARAGRARCLLLAREAVAAQPGASVALGLVIEEGVAFPHAWVKTPAGAEDPSVLPDDPTRSGRRYLEVPRARAGAFYLSLFSGAVQLVEPSR